MNEFEQYLTSQYGLKQGDPIPDDVYEKASAEFVQSRSTMNNIAPSGQAFDLGQAMASAPQSPAAASGQPQAAAQADGLAGTPFDYENAVPLLEQFVSDFIDKENLRTGAKYGDKAEIEQDWMNARDQIYAPELGKLGITPARAQLAAAQIVNGKAANVLEALGVPQPGGGAAAGEDPSKLIWERDTMAKSFNEDGALDPEEARMLEQYDQKIEAARFGAAQKKPSAVGAMREIDRELSRVQQYSQRNAVNQPFKTIYGDEVSGRDGFQGYGQKLMEDRARMEADLVVALSENDPEVLNDPNIISHSSFRTEKGLDTRAIGEAIAKAPMGAYIWNGQSLTRKGAPEPKGKPATRTKTQPANPNQDLESTVIDAQTILNDPNAPIAKTAKAQADIGRARAESSKRAGEQEKNRAFLDKVERAGAVESEMDAARNELSELGASLTVPQTKETAVGRMRGTGSTYQLPLAGRVRNPDVDDETYAKGLERMAEIRVRLGEDDKVVRRDLGLGSRPMMSRAAPASGRGR